MTDETNKTNAAAAPAAPAFAIEAGKTYRPNEIAAGIGVDGKLVRGFLRTNFTRAAELKNSTWILDSNVAQEVVDHFESRKTRANAKVVTRADATNAS